MFKYCLINNPLAKDGKNFVAMVRSGATGRALQGLSIKRTSILIAVSTPSTSRPLPVPAFVVWQRLRIR